PRYGDSPESAGQRGDWRGWTLPEVTGPVRHGPPRPTRVSIAAAQPVQYLIQLVGLDQHLARLRPLARPDDAARLHQVHQPPGLGEPDPQLALQHRGRAELRADHQLGGLDEQLQVVADVLVDLLAGFLRRRQDIRPELRLPLVLAELDDIVDLRLADPGALDPDRLGRAHRQEQAVAAADQLLRAGLGEDHPRGRKTRRGERQPGPDSP